jgi:small subunit ribosomal protein S6
MSKNIKKVSLLQPVATTTPKKYELALLLPPVLPEDVKNKIIPRISELLSKHAGSVTMKEEWGKRHLAYEINGNEEGYYVFLNLQIVPSNLKAFESELSRMKSDVLRFLIISEENL